MYALRNSQTDHISVTSWYFLPFHTVAVLQGMKVSNPYLLNFLGFDSSSKEVVLKDDYGNK